MATKPRKRRGGHGHGAVRKLPSGRFQAKWKDNGGKYHPAPSTFVTEADAWDWLSARQMGFISMPDQRTFGHGVTFAEFAQSWLETRRARGSGMALRPRTRAHYRDLLERMIYPHFGARRLDEIKRAEVERWWDMLPPDTPVQNAHAYSLLSSIMNSAVRRDIIGKSPCMIEGAGKSPKKPRPSIITLDELETLVENIPDRYQVMILIAAWCGFRSGELRALRRKDFRVQADGATLTVDRGVVRVKDDDGEIIDLVGPPKSSAGKRTIRVPDSLVEPLKEHIEKYAEKGKDGLIFPAEQGGFMHPNTMQDVYKKAAKAANRPELRLHDLRHAAGTRASQAGATLAEIMRFLGDSSVQAVMRYQHADDTRMAEISQRMDQMRRR